MPRHIKSPAGPKPQSTNNTVAVTSIVKGVISDIRANGDAAVRQYSEKFDKWSPAAFKLSADDIQAAIAKVPEQTIKDIKECQSNVRRFAEAQRHSLKDFEMELMPGVILGQRSLPIARVGAYVLSSPRYLSMDHVGIVIY
jgi:histidinol dehydrogenase